MKDNSSDKHLIKVQDQPFLVGQTPDETVELRDAVLKETAEYCAEISDMLWMDFSQHIVPTILKKKWDGDLHLKFLEFRRLIDRQGMFGAAELILLGLRELASDQKQ